MNVSALALLVTLAASDTLSAPPTRAPEGNLAPASVIVHHQPAIPIVALRMSLLVDDPPGFAGAGHLIQHLHEPRLREQSRRVGGHVQIQRSSDAIVYTVIGPAAELEYLGGILISALRAPSPTPGEMVVALRDLREERLAEWETAAAHVRAHLRSRLFPEDLSAAGTESSSERLTSSRIRPLWGELYRPDRVSVVAVGAVELEQVQRVFSDLPSPPPERIREAHLDTVPESRRVAAEATRGWLGIGYSGSDLDAPAMTVTARLLSDALRERIPNTEVSVEHWWTHHGQALVAVVAVPENRLASARRDIGTAITRLEEDLTDRTIRAAAIAARRDILFHSRTPDQMAEVVGRFADRDGHSDAAQRFFDQLGRVRLEDVQEIVDRLSERTPVRVDIPPQVLQRQR